MSEVEEFLGLCRRYVKIHGKAAPSSTLSRTQLGRLRITYSANDHLIIEHFVGDGIDVRIESVWLRHEGFIYDGWKRYLTPLRRTLILDRLADV